MSTVKLYDRELSDGTPVTVALEDGRFVVLGQWLGQERIVFDPGVGSTSFAEETCVRYCKGANLDYLNRVGAIHD